MTNVSIFPQLDIPQTIAAGPGPGNTDARVLARFAGAGLADHMHPEVLRGWGECKQMLRDGMGTDNVHTYGVAGTGWSGLDVMFSAVMPGDSVVMFVNGTFSGIDGLTVRMKAATAEELAANPMDPQPASVTIINVPHGQSVTAEIVHKALATHKPKWAAMAHWETGSGRVNDIRGFSDAGVEDFRIDDYPGVDGWASCPQKGICCLPLTYAPVSFTDHYIEELKKTGTRTFVHHPILEARHWGIIDGKDTPVGTYHRTHSAYAVAAFHEALRITLQQTVAQRAKDYAFHEAALKDVVTAMGCDVTSNMTSLIVLNLPEDMAGREMELVQHCRAQNFGIWPTLSEPVQVRIGILNLLNEAAICDIVSRFGKAMRDLGATFSDDAVNEALNRHYKQAIAAE